MRRVNDIDREFRKGFITDDERYNQTVDVWRATTDDVTEKMLNGLDKRGSVWMITHSGARGNVTQVHQLAGMRGLMADPSGRIIDLPIRSNLREGMSVLEYFISSHGARKGLADTALRTADSGYLTRRLVDVAQDVITREDDCDTDRRHLDHARRVGARSRSRSATGWSAAWRRSTWSTRRPARSIVARNDEIDEVAIERIEAAGIDRVNVRSPLTCAARHGVCRMCYGRNLATGNLVELGQAVGIIAAQSIGEPGTQLTMRTFHTGGVAGEDITQGLPRVEELFEARIPKGQATMTEIDGVGRGGASRRRPADRGAGHASRGLRHRRSSSPRSTRCWSPRATRWPRASCWPAWARATRRSRCAPRPPAASPRRGDPHPALGGRGHARVRGAALGPAAGRERTTRCWPAIR